MGLFDFLSRRGSSRSAEADRTDPRCDHYSFTHVVLRDAAFANPVGTVTALATAGATDFIHQLWEQVLATCESHQQPIEIQPADILVHKMRAGIYPCALVEMPTPQRPTEAFFIALVLAVQMTGEEWSFQSRPLRYFTLELASSNANDLQTVIGEWETADQHTTHGPGPYPELNDFLQRVTDLISSRRL